MDRGELVWAEGFGYEEKGDGFILAAAQCSSAYAGGVVTGNVAAFGAFAFGAVPANLVHYTSSLAAARSIRATGHAASSSGLFGAGVYAVSRGATVSMATVPSSANVATRIINTSGFIRTPLGTYVRNSTAGGSAQLAASYGAATLANNNPVGNSSSNSGCGCP